MNCKDNIEWLKSLKQQIGQTQHCDLWHFEQVIDETIANLEPLAKPHGRLIDADKLTKNMRNYYPSIDHLCCSQHVVTKGDIDNAPTVIEAEHESEARKWARVGGEISKGLQGGIEVINAEVKE